MDYWVIRPGAQDAGVIDALPEGSPQEWKFDRGEPLLSQYPENAAVRFSRNWPDARELYDFTDTVLDVFFVSEKVQTIIKSLGVENVEFLPVSVLDHKGVAVGPNYAIMNVLGSQDAIDMEASEFVMSALKKTQISDLDLLHLDYEQIDDDAQIFRMANMMTLFLIREDVKDAFTREGVTGYKVFAADGWDGLDF